MAYNVEKYIEECLNSIITQKVNFKYQIYVGNDGSDDGTVKILEQYKKKYPKIIVCEIKNSDVLTILNQESYKFLYNLGYTLISKTVLSCIFILNK
jgi:glycosyltransferase involved in cell wall biosynthesis